MPVRSGHDFNTFIGSKKNSVPKISNKMCGDQCVLKFYRKKRMTIHESRLYKIMHLTFRRNDPDEELALLLE